MACLLDSMLTPLLPQELPDRDRSLQLGWKKLAYHASVQHSTALPFQKDMRPTTNPRATLPRGRRIAAAAKRDSQPGYLEQGKTRLGIPTLFSRH